MHKNQSGNFAVTKRQKREKRTQFSPKKAKTGCVLGAGGDGNGWKRIKPGEKTQCPNPNEHQNHATHEKRKPAKTQCFRRFCGRGRRTCLGCRLGRFAAERHWRSLTPRHALRRGAAVPRCRVLMRANGKKERQAGACLSFLAGAEGLEPSARGFGVDVETAHREWGRGGVARSPRSSPQRAVLIWCYEESEVEKACRAISFSSPTTISFWSLSSHRCRK